jgi:ribosomal protein L37AE/L43A
MVSYWNCEKCKKRIDNSPESMKGCKHYDPKRLLKPCPLCGGQIVFAFNQGSDWRCMNCGAEEDKIMEK